MTNLPVIIQGGMGAGVSDWRLAKAVCNAGQLGVVSGTALDHILVRRLQEGDKGGHMYRALQAFPFKKISERIWDKYFIPGGKAPNRSYHWLPMNTEAGVRELQELCTVANFAEVFLAREGHDRPVGINYLEKVQLAHLPSLYGAMLAGVSYVLMGAGIPIKIPQVLDRLARHQPATYPLHVSGAHDGGDILLHFDPREFMEYELGDLYRPRFLAIIASNTLASTLLKKADGRIDGFIIEGHTAGGHNAPPRGKLQLDQSGQAIYGERDQVDLEKIAALGLPFWLAGGFGDSEKLQDALNAGAAGIQVGTAFAFCEESGLDEKYKRALVRKSLAGTATVFTDPFSSPTGFPFKAAQLEGTASEKEIYDERTRVCDVGYLREPYWTPTGTIGYRCAAESVSTYVAKGGVKENAAGKKCLCNALLANIGLAQVRPDGYVEIGLITAGDDLSRIARFVPEGQCKYSAADVVASLLANHNSLQPDFNAALAATV